MAELVEHGEVSPRQMIGDASLPAGSGLRFKLVDEIDGVEEAPAHAGSDASSGGSDRQMRLQVAPSAIPTL